MKNFKETGLNSNLLKAVAELGFETPTPIQAQVIPFLLSATQDLLAYAQTGTGKTAAFGLPIIEQIDIKSRITQAIILSPTRELCIQITKDLTEYAKFTTGLNIVPVYGGASIDNQISQLSKGAHIVVGTPGRLIDLMQRKRLKISEVRFLVLDEADEMLSMGFKDELDTILAETPEDKQTLLFSATLPKEIKEIARTYMKDPFEIGIGKRNVGADNVQHFYYNVSAKQRYLALKRIADASPDIYGIVFCQTRQETKDIADKLIEDGYNADALHGDLSQAQRDLVMHRFRVKNLQLLIATDVAARGLDVSDLTHTINYNLPQEAEIYIHRSGRTGRAGKSGIAISIIHSKEIYKLREIEKLLGKKFTQKPVPGGLEICEKQLFHLIDKVEKIVVNEEEILQFIPAITSKLEQFDREELIKRFVSIEFNRFASYYKDAPDLNVKESERNERKERSASFSRIYLNIGSKQNLAPRDLINMINDTPELRSAQIGKIDIQRKFTFFEIDTKYEAAIIKAFQDIVFDDMPLYAEIASQKNEPEQRNFDRGFQKETNWRKKRSR